MRMIKLMCATGVTMVACLTMTGCGSSKPEKAFCKAENRVIPDDELMARALLAMRKPAKNDYEKYHKVDLPTEIETYLKQNLPSSASDEQVASALIKYVRQHPDWFSFRYDPEGVVQLGMSQLPLDYYASKTDSRSEPRYYGDLMVYDTTGGGGIELKGFSPAVFTCGSLMFYNAG